MAMQDNDIKWHGLKKFSNNSVFFCLFFSISFSVICQQDMEEIKIIRSQNVKTVSCFVLQMVRMRFREVNAFNQIPQFRLGANVN